MKLLEALNIATNTLVFAVDDLLSQPLLSPAEQQATRMMEAAAERLGAFAEALANEKKEESTDALQITERTESSTGD